MIDSISYHVSGTYPTRLRDVDERDDIYCIVRIPRGFETLDIAIYGDGLTESDACEAAFDFLLENHPESLSESEREDSSTETWIVSFGGNL